MKLPIKKTAEGVWKPDHEALKSFAADARKFNAQHKIYAYNDRNLKRQILRDQRKLERESTDNRASKRRKQNFRKAVSTLLAPLELFDKD